MSWANLSRMRQTFVSRVPTCVYSTGMERINGLVVDGGRAVVVGTQEGFGKTNVLVMDSGHVERTSEAVIVPFGVARSTVGHTFVSDSCHGIMQVFDDQWVLVREIGEIESIDDGTFFRMGGVACTPSGGCWVADTLNHCIKLFTPQGVRVGVIGSKGLGAGEFDCPCGIAVAKSGAVYVTDSNNYRVQVFDENMAFVREFGHMGWGAGEFRRPKHIAVTADGNSVFVSDALRGDVQEFDGNGRYVRTIGWFGSNTPMTVDSDGALYIAVLEGLVNKYA
jgi:DNA-binding beta-propeller fold protein YncE